MATSAARIGVPSWSRARRWGSSEEPQKVWRSLLPGSGPKVDSGARTAMGRAASAATIEVTIRGRRAIPVSSSPPVMISAAAVRDSSLLRIGCRSSIASSSGISVLAQWTAAAPTKKTAMATEADGQVGPPQRVPGAGVGEEVRVLRCDQEVGRDEDHGSQYGEQEERCHDPFGPLGRPWVGVGLPVDVRGQPGVREAATLLGRDRADAALGGGAVEIVVHSRIHFAFAPSHTAQATSRDRTMVHTYRPSVTGPWLPREMPPGDPVSSSAWR